MEDQAVHIVSEVGEGDLRLGADDADGADEQRHLVRLAGEHVFDAGTDGRSGDGGMRGACRHRPAPIHGRASHDGAASLEHLIRHYAVAQ